MKCSIGYEVSGFEQCVPCPPNTYKDDINMKKCAKCSNEKSGATCKIIGKHYGLFGVEFDHDYL